MDTKHLIFHYTSSEALPFILDSKENSLLRATGIRYLNDQSELHFGIERALDILKNKRSEIVHDAVLVDKLIERFEENALKHMSFNFYITCFSKANGLVDQWRGYGDNGLGFALGYNETELYKSFTNTSKYKVQSCLYERKEQEHALISVVNNALDCLYRTFIDSKDSKEDEYATDMYYIEEAIQRQLLRFKHGAYQQEKEFRVVADLSGKYLEVGENASADPKPSFRSSKRGLIPFITLQLPAPKMLIVGPSEYQAENRAAAELLLNTKGFTPDEDILIENEDIPYRG